MFEEALAPFLQDMERYRTLGLPTQASACCLGILQGIYDFGKDSSTQCSTMSPASNGNNDLDSRGAGDFGVPSLHSSIRPFTAVPFT